MAESLNAGRILVTGAAGQIGSELVPALRRRYGSENVVAGYNRTLPGPAVLGAGPFEIVDVTRRETLKAVVDKHNVNTIYHMAAILSAVAEERPQEAWNVNVNGLCNVLEIARERQSMRIFCPSSIAVFGPRSPRDDTPQDAFLDPTTIYGISKVTGEFLCGYYAKRFGLDIRGVRYPGIISSKTLPGGGTTDYAVAIFYEAVAKGRYTCFVREDTVLPMMYMPDCIRGAIELMEADRSKLKHCVDYNLAAMSFSAGQLAAEIRKHIPDFVCEYRPDSRQAIADSWPRSIDDRAARDEWGWCPEFDLPSMTADMLARLRRRHENGALYPGQESVSEEK